MVVRVSHEATFESGLLPAGATEPGKRLPEPGGREEGDRWRGGHGPAAPAARGDCGADGRWQVQAAWRGSRVERCALAMLTFHVKQEASHCSTKTSYGSCAETAGMRFQRRIRGYTRQQYGDDCIQCAQVMAPAAVMQIANSSPPAVHRTAQNQAMPPARLSARLTCSSNRVAMLVQNLLSKTRSLSRPPRVQAHNSLQAQARSSRSLSSSRRCQTSRHQR